MTFYFQYHCYTIGIFVHNYNRITKISLKKIYDEVTEDIFDMSNVRLFKEIEKKNEGCFYFVMSSVS